MGCGALLLALLLVWAGACRIVPLAEAAAQCDSPPHGIGEDVTVMGTSARPLFGAGPWFLVTTVYTASRGDQRSYEILTTRERAEQLTEQYAAGTKTAACAAFEPSGSSPAEVARIASGLSTVAMQAESELAPPEWLILVPMLMLAAALVARHRTGQRSTA
jgi:hypothetical protein